MQNRKALVLAVGMALAMPMYGYAKGGGDDEGGEAKGDPDSVVTLYGKLYPEVNYPKGKGATDKTQTTCTICAPGAGTNAIISKQEVESSNSRFGVRGYEKLGGDLRAIFQLETTFHVDANDTTFADRDSFVGLDHKRWGTIKLGKMDTPFKTYGDEISFLGVSSGNFTSSSNLLRKTGFGTNSASSFHLRRQNVVQYETVDYAGFNGAVQYSTDEAPTSVGSGNNLRNPHVWSGAVAWEGGPIRLSLAHEEHWDLFGGSRNVPTAMSNFTDMNVRSKDKATQAMIIYKLGAHRFEADFTRKEYNENATITGRFSNYKNNAYQLIWDARWSRQWRTGVQYIHSDKGSCSRVNAVCTTDGLDGSQLQIGAAYYFSRRTYMFMQAAFLKNDFSARYNNEAQQTPNPGEDITIYSVGINHSF
jgi:predicted porin